MRPTVRKLAVPGVMVLGLGAGLTLADAARDPLPELGAQQSAPAAIATPADLSTAFRAASRAAMPAVVHVRVEKAARQARMEVPDHLRGTPFEDMFRGQGRIPQQNGSGSGFIVTPDGYIYTNNHVVESADRVIVVLNDKREFAAKVVGRDPNTDVAVIKIDARNLPTVRLGSSDALETGDWVLALGYPLSLGQTTTAGIVSAKGRELGIMRTTGAEAPLEHFIQTDAAINPGNSGGPLVDLQGRVVGINSAIASPTGFYSGYGFAVPIELARRVGDDLVRYGEVHRPMLGVEIRDATGADAEVFRLDGPNGAVVASEPKAGARDAGLRLGDVIVAVDGQRVNDTGDLMETVMRKQPGERVRVDVVRYGERKRFEVRLASFDVPRTAQRAEEGEPVEADDTAAERVGFEAVALTPEIARELELPAGGGVVVSSVDPTGPAAGQLLRGLQVLRLNGREIRGVADLKAAVEAVRPGQVVSILARRPGGGETIVNFRARS